MNARLRLALVLISFAAPARAAEPVNVVLIVADDLGWGDLSSYGHPRFRTPRLDRLAAEGARLTRFYAPCPFCAPSRAAILTGRYPFRCGMTSNPAPDAGIDDPGLPDSEVTLGELFQAAGYRTACIGKWHLGHRPRFHPLRHGFHEYLGILYSNDMRPVELWDGEAVVERTIDQNELTRRYTDRALRFLEENRARPFFLYLPHAMPHKPLAASASHRGKSGAGLYGDVMAELDESVGRVADRLAELGLAERTLLIFTSDNGPWHGGSTGGLRGMKSTTWEGGIRIPLIARWPGRIPAGGVIAEPAMLPDLFATALAAAGIDAPRDRTIDGRDLIPLLEKGFEKGLAKGARSPHAAILAMKDARVSAVVSGRWKLHLLPPGGGQYLEPGAPWKDPRGPDGTTIIAPAEQYHPSEYPGTRRGDPGRPLALFDLETDPAEERDVAKDHPEEVKRLARLARPPNVVLILADDLGAHDLAVDGHRFHRTPALDRMAREGMRFTSAYAAAPICSPTRAAILTGKHPARLRLTDWLPGRADRPDQKMMRPDFQKELPLEETTLAEALKRRGYATGHIGKWHLGGKGRGPLEQGFDRNVAGDHTGTPRSWFHPFRKGDDAMPGLEEGNEGEYLTDRLTDEALKFIEENRARPFFLYLAHNAVHIPLQAKKEAVARWESAPRPDGVHANPVYAAMVESLDESVGRVLAKLTELGLEKDTLVVFTSDNGGLSVREGPNTPATSNSPLRAGKGYLHEGGLRVPLIARWPGTIPAARESAEPVVSMDLFATILEAAGLESAARESQLDGRSVLAHLRGEAAPAPRALHWHYPHYSNQGGKPGGAIREGAWKLIERYEDGGVELHDLERDPGETRDLANEEAERAKGMRERLEAWRRAVGAQGMRVNPEFRGR